MGCPGRWRGEILAGRDGRVKRIRHRMSAQTKSSALAAPDKLREDLAELPPAILAAQW